MDTILYRKCGMKYQTKAPNYSDCRTRRKFLFKPIRYKDSKGNYYRAWLELAYIWQEYIGSWGGSGWENKAISFTGEAYEEWYEIVHWYGH
jgi:hypothetical protein